MAHVVVEDVCASWCEYERATEGLVGALPNGLILHVAGPTDEGVRIVELWSTEAAAAEFRRQLLGPALTRLARGPRPESVLRELHPVHVVLRPTDTGQLVRTTRRKQ